MHGTALNSDTIEASRFVKDKILSYETSSTYKSPNLCCNLLNLLTHDMKPNLQQSKDYWSKQAKYRSKNKLKILSVEKLKEILQLH